MKYLVWLNVSFGPLRLPVKEFLEEKKVNTIVKPMSPSLHWESEINQTDWTRHSVVIPDGYASIRRKFRAQFVKTVVVYLFPLFRPSTTLRSSGNTSSASDHTNSREAMTNARRSGYTVARDPPQSSETLKYYCVVAANDDGLWVHDDCIIMNELWCSDLSRTPWVLLVSRPFRFFFIARTYPTPPPTHELTEKTFYVTTLTCRRWNNFCGDILIIPRETQQCSTALTFDCFSTYEAPPVVWRLNQQPWCIQDLPA